MFGDGDKTVEWLSNKNTKFLVLVRVSLAVFVNFFYTNSRISTWENLSCDSFYWTFVVVITMCLTESWSGETNDKLASWLVDKWHLQSILKLHLDNSCCYYYD